MESFIILAQTRIVIIKILLPIKSSIDYWPSKYIDKVISFFFFSYFSCISLSKDTKLKDKKRKNGFKQGRKAKLQKTKIVQKMKILKKISDTDSEKAN